MDTELFELCKEVYKRTGWEISDKPSDWYTQTKVSDGAMFQAPLYTSDYLLEKLGDLDDEVQLTRCFHQDSSRNWCITYGSDRDGVHEIFSYEDTPLKSLLKLAIALHDNGIKL